MESESEIIWHYTSNVEQFLSEEAVFLGSRSDFFEDETELIYGQNLFDDVANEFSWLKERSIPRRQFHYYIACFSLSKDIKRYWDERTPKGGYAIGFDRKKVEQAINTKPLVNIKEKIYFTIATPVFYCQECFKNYIRSQIEEIREEKTYLRTLFAVSKRDIYCAFYKDMTKFAWENEFRIIRCTNDQIREKDDMGRPCYPIFNIKPEMIKQIIVSPYGDVSENILKAKNLCNGIGISPKIVTKSRFYGDYR